MMNRQINKSKIVLMIGLMLSFFLNAIVYSQDDSSAITVNERNISLRSLLKNITSQSQAHFVFEDKHIDGKMLSCFLAKTSLDEILSDITIRTGLAYKMINSATVVLFEAKPNIFVEKISPSISEILPPVLQVNIEPDYPSSAQDTGLEGAVEMRLLISTKGMVKKAQIVKSSGHRVLDQAALKFVKKYHFHPAQEEGKPLEVWLPWVLDYQLVDKLSQSTRYVNQIMNYRNDLQNLNDKNQRQTLQRILDLHVEQAQTLNTSNCCEANKNIKRIVSPQIYQSWVQFENNHPLYFLVFHDFILRYPNSVEIDYAKSNLFHFVKREITTMQNLKNDRFKIVNEYFLKSLMMFLENMYPQVYKSQFSEEVINLPY